MNNTKQVFNNLLFVILCTVIVLILFSICYGTNLTTHPEILFVILGFTFCILPILLIGNGSHIIFIALLLRGILDWFSPVSFVFGLNPASIFAIFITILIFIKLLLDRKKIFIKNSIPLLFFIFWSIFLLIIGFGKINLQNSLEEIMKLISSFAILTSVISYAKTEKVQQQILGVVVISALPSLLYGFINLDSPTNFVQGIGLPRAQSFFSHPNNYAHYLLVIFIFLMIYFEWEKDQSKRLFLVLLRVTQFIVAFCILLTFSRSGIVALGLIIVLFRVKNLKTFSYALFIISIIFFILYYFFPEFISYTINITLTSNNIHESTLASRFDIWSTALHLIKNNWLFGVGPGQSNILIGIIAHNDYIRIFLEYGLLGIIFYFWVLFRQLFDSQLLKRYAKNIVSSKSYYLAKGGLSLFLSFAFIAFFTNNFNSTITEWYKFALWGLIIVKNENITGKL